MKNLIQSFGILTLLIGSMLIGNAACSPKVIPMPGDWQLLGTRTVDYGLDRDEIAVTAREGFFTALKIRVDRSALNMHKMVVHFGDGSTQEVALKSVFKAGQESRVIDLPGNRRIITSIVFWYDTKKFRKQKAVVELWGRH